MITTIEVPTGSREQMVDVTARVQQAVTDSGAQSGMVMCFVTHTTAAVTINENADPDVTRDILYKLNKEIPQRDGYHHAEGNSDAHIKTSLIGSHVAVPVRQGRLELGTWQSIYLAEFDGPRSRQVEVTVVGSRS